MHTPVTVAFVSDQRTHEVKPVKLIWEKRPYTITKLGLHHRIREGRTLFHVFSVESETLFFKLVLNTETLDWMVVEIADGEVN